MIDSKRSSHIKILTMLTVKIQGLINTHAKPYDLIRERERAGFMRAFSGIINTPIKVSIYG